MNIILISMSWEMGLKRKVIRMALKNQMDGTLTEPVWLMVRVKLEIGKLKVLE